VAAAGRVDRWKLEAVEKYLKDAFLEGSVEHTPRGAGSAEIFVVRGRTHVLEAQKVLHQLWIARSFFDRFTDSGSLRDALDGADVAAALKRSGDKVLEIY
jgi:hypothetical protein